MRPRPPMLIKALLVVLAVQLLVLWLQPRMAFFPLTGVQRTPADAGVPFEELRLTTEDGETITAWWLPSDETNVEVVFWHGNGGNLSLWMGVLIELRAQGWSVLGFDYRGYGTSSGHPTERGLYRDTEAVLRHFQTSLHKPGARVVYWGRSLGGAPAAHGARVLPPDAIVLERTFPSMRSLFDRSPLMFVLSLFSTYRFPTARLLAGVTKPVLVIHGDADSIIPLRHGRTLHEMLPGSRLLVVPGGDHNDFEARSHRLYWDAVRSFIGGGR